MQRDQGDGGHALCLGDCVHFVLWDLPVPASALFPSSDLAVHPLNICDAASSDCQAGRVWELSVWHQSSPELLGNFLLSLVYYESNSRLPWEVSSAALCRELEFGAQGRWKLPTSLAFAVPVGCRGSVTGVLSHTLLLFLFQTAATITSDSTIFLLIKLHLY